MKVHTIMPDGPGKYDDLADLVREKAQAHVAMVMILGGNHGNGFSVASVGAPTFDLPYLLRTTANQIEKSLKKTQH